MDQQGQCERLKKDGTRCRAQALPGKSLCCFHDPELAAKRAEGRKRGGQARSKPAVVLPPDTPELPLRTVADVITALGLTINQTRKGELDVKVANAVGYLSGVLLHALKDGELEQRLAALEARLAAQGPHQQTRLNGSPR
jgi:hypothetical protein